MLPAGSRAVSTSTPQPCPANTHHYSDAQLSALRPAVEAMVGNNYATLGNGADTIDVELLPGQEALATALIARFQGAVQVLSVGSVPYRCGVPTKSRRCPDLQGSTVLPPGLHLTLKLAASTMPATGMVDGELVVQEDSPTPFEMDPGQPIVAAIVRPGTRTVVGQYAGPLAGTGFGIDLHDGEQKPIKAVVAAWRCDGNRGSTLPPGHYGVRAGIGPNEGPPEYLAPEVPVTITA